MVKSVQDESTEQRILSAARQVFVQKGLDGARMQDIADAAGINKALLHYYFRSKEKLFETIFREVAAEFFPRLSLILESDKTLFEKIELFAEAYIDQMKATPYLPVFVLSEMNRQPAALMKKMWPAQKPPIHLLAAQVEKEVRQGVIKPIHPAQLLMNLLALCVFPFVARPVFQMVGGIDQKLFDELIEARKKEVPRFIMDAIRK